MATMSDGAYDLLEVFAVSAIVFALVAPLAALGIYIIADSIIDILDDLRKR